jgi:hypothetical protein
MERISIEPAGEIISIIATVENSRGGFGSI